MPKTVRVPPPFEGLFDQAETFVGELFGQLAMRPEEGTVHIGGERYVLMRGESLFVALFDSLTDAFGEDQAHEFLYNIARVLGANDSKAYARDRKVEDPVARLSAGPVHFSHAGWAFVDIYENSAPAQDDSYFMQYNHPNTFESEVWKKRKGTAPKPCCFFSSGYSAGWCSSAFSFDVHAREMTCTARGDDKCEFIMAPFDRLDEYATRLYGRTH